MSSQSLESHRRVLPLGEFTVTIPDQHATLQGAVTWRNQYHDRATLQVVRIPSAILKIVFRHILFFLFLMQFRLWRAAAFVSSPIHLLNRDHVVVEYCKASFCWAETLIGECDSSYTTDPRPPDGPLHIARRNASMDIKHSRRSRTALLLSVN